MSKESSDIEKIVEKSSKGVMNLVVKKGIFLMMIPIEIMKAVMQDIGAKLKK